MLNLIASNNMPLYRYYRLTGVSVRIRVRFLRLASRATDLRVWYFSYLVSHKPLGRYAGLAVAMAR